jgi:hypothetical protein
LGIIYLTPLRGKMTISPCEKCNGGIVNTAKSNTCDQCGGDASTIEIKNPTIPVYVFHCPAYCTSYGYGKDGLKNYGVFRYANGLWLRDDGQADMAFIGYSPYDCGKGGAPIFYGVELSWDLWRHPNKVAYDSACYKCVEINGCASGLTVNPDECRKSSI